MQASPSDTMDTADPMDRLRSAMLIESTVQAVLQSKIQIHEVEQLLGPAMRAAVPAVRSLPLPRSLGDGSGASA